MTNVVMTVDKVGKVFRRYRHELHRVLGWFSLPVGQPEERWVLRDISFTVEAGRRWRLLVAMARARAHCSS